MLRFIPPTPPLSAAEQFALDALVDQSRVLPATSGDAVELRLVGGGATPTIAAARGRDWCVAARDGFIELDRPLLSLVAELAGAVLEQRSPAEDRFGRVPPTENALVRAGEDRAPVVGHMAVALRRAVIAAAGRKRCALVSPWPEGKRWAVAMTHDLDIVSLWPGYSALRVAQLTAAGHPLRALTVAFRALGALVNNPVRRAALEVMRLELERKVRSTWFVLAGTPTFASIRAGDLTYVPEHPIVREILVAVRAAGHEFGLHGSFATFVTRDVFVEQRNRLTAVAALPASGVRQHFLRMRPGVSHAAMAGAGFTYDSTYGFSERNGFRLGVADVIPVWDERGNRALPIDEVPFVWMDRALSKYRNIEDPRVWINDGFAIARAVREVDGVWNGVWHPNMDDALGFPGAPSAFRVLLDGLLEQEPWSATLGEIVAWRRARRNARATASPASGPIPLRSSGATLALEDATGKRVDHVSA